MFITRLLNGIDRVGQGIRAGLSPGLPAASSYLLTSHFLGYLLWTIMGKIWRTAQDSQEKGQYWSVSPHNWKQFSCSEYATKKPNILQVTKLQSSQDPHKYFWATETQITSLIWGKEPGEGWRFAQSQRGKAKRDYPHEPSHCFLSAQSLPPPEPAGLLRHGGAWRAKAWKKQQFLEHVGERAMKFPFQSDSTWKIPVPNTSEPPTTCPPHKHGLFLSQPLSLMLLCVYDRALPARDNSISVQQIQHLIEFSHLYQGRNSSARPQSWELFFERTGKLAMKSNMALLNHF